MSAGVNELFNSFGPAAAKHLSIVAPTVTLPFACYIFDAASAAHSVV